ncbi:hypothetical protein IAQ61_000094 [Plenodomus lingam]|uniref:uncharacterized protein n=1 Tax=Leptosphaeria maculans TaxID=5022 RepID=UPI00332337CB|nr:hypothetical protein IAQ61_000094 [Plenodomus lingam]
MSSANRGWSSRAAKPTWAALPFVILRAIFPSDFGAPLFHPPTLSLHIALRINHFAPARRATCCCNRFSRLEPQQMH